MNDNRKTKEQLIQELEDLRRRIAELEKSETERKQVDEALRESEEKFRTIFDGASDGMLIADAITKKFLQGNNAICSMLGYTNEEIKSLTIYDIHPSKDISHVVDEFEKLVKGEKVLAEDLPVLRKDGSIFYADISAALTTIEGIHRLVGIFRDITERKQAEEDLYKSEERYRTILEDIDEGYYENDLAGNFTFVNDAECRDLGYSREELIGMNYRQYSDEATAKNLYELFDNIYNTGKPVKRFLEQFISKDGTRHFNEVSASLIRDAKGKPLGFRGVSRDITDRKRAEEALRASEELFRSYLEYAPDGVYMSDLEGNFLYGNRKCEEIIGYRREELIGKNFLELSILSENSLNKAAQLLQANIEGKSTGPDEIELINKEGRLIPVEINTSVVQRMGQGIILAFVRDITDRKQAEELLRESEKRYRELTDFLPISISTFEVDDTGRIISFNRSALEVFGYNEEDFKEGMNAIQFFAPEEWQRVEENMGKVIQGTSTPGQEFTFIRKDGRKFIGLIYASPTIHQNKTAGIRGVIIDITERKRAEEALRESEDRYRELSIVDDLTQLYNSRHFYFQLKIELDRSNRYELPLTLLMLDLDNFKAFNDAYGHVKGDQVLIRIGQVFKRCLRETDFAYRYGGEEFTILLPMTTSADGAVTAERIRTEFKKETFSPAPGQDVHVTVSIGIAQYKQQEEMKVFVHRVDQLMYQAKKNGKDRARCEP